MTHQVRLVPAMFDEQASRQPEAVAIAGAQTQISYGELAGQVNRLARYLRQAGVGPETVVGVSLDRGAAVIRCLLAIVKAGGAYLPLDPSLPPSRLARMCEQAQFVLAGRATSALAGVTYLKPDQKTLAALPGTPPGLDQDPGDLAYAIYTSGTTGEPKAVGVTHGSLACVTSELARAYRISPADRVLQMASLSFDTSIEQILVTLLSGATLVLPPAGTVAPSDLLGHLAAQRVTVADLTPAYWHRVLASAVPRDERLSTVRLMITGGDAASAQDCHAARVAAPDARMLNAYGLTETTITSTLYDVGYDVGTAPDAPVPVGVPIPHARALVLDRDLRPVPAGVVGEVYLGGCGVARGYLGRAELTAERFLPDHTSEVPGAKLFRSGDLGMLRADGNLVVTGRVDRQLKVRGFRVEPAEIEHVLAAHPAVDLVAVVARDTAHGDKQLAAYFTSGAGPASPGDLADFAAARLPAFMVPAEFVPVDHMPLTHEGKVDRQALAYPVVAGGHSPEGEQYTLTQAGMSHLWARLLDAERVDLDDDFFRLGGNSLLAAEMLAHVRVMFGVGAGYVRPLTRSLLRDPTLRGFAAATQDARAGRLASGDVDPGIDFAAEAALDIPVCHDGGPPPAWRQPRAVLLTGVTGFFGIHLLRDLLTRTTARVHCLVRADDSQHALRRIASAAARYELGPLDLDRVVPAPGDLAEPDLGLPAAEFDELARTIDIIYHAGATVNFIYPYEELRPANVTGTRELIRLACRYRAIPLHYVSSTAVLAGFGIAGVRAVAEDEPLAHAGSLCVGYVQSKYVAEEMVRNAARAGLPVAIYRPMDIVGSGRTGAWNTSTEMCGLIRFIADTGTAPDIDLPLDFVPADVFAAALTHISTSTGASGRTYHIAAPEHVRLGYLVDRLRRYGYGVRQLPYRDWVHELLRHAAGSPSHPMTPFVPLFVDHCPGTSLTIAEMYLEHVFPSYSTSNTERALHDSGIEFPIPSDGLVDRNIAHLIATGFLAAPGGSAADDG